MVSVKSLKQPQNILFIFWPYTTSHKTLVGRLLHFLFSMTSAAYSLFYKTLEIYKKMKLYDDNPIIYIGLECTLPTICSKIEDTFRYV